MDGSATSSYDSHTLYILCGFSSLSELKRNLDRAIEEAGVILKEKLDCRYLIKLVQNQKIVDASSAYVYLTDSRVYYMLLGFNPDGSKHVKVTETVTVKKIHQSKNNDMSSWADIVEDDVEEIETKIVERTETPLPPLLEIGLYEVEEKNVEILPHVFPGSRIEKVGDKVFADYTIYRAEAREVYESCHHNIISAYKSRGVTIDDVQKHFSIFSASKNDGFRESRRGQKKYPFVRETDKLFTVTFDPATNDAIFALFLNSWTKINDIEMKFQFMKKYPSSSFRRY